MLTRFAGSALLLALAASSYADLTVKARITTFATSVGHARDITLYSKDTWIRTDSDGKSVIRDTRSGKMILINKDRKEYRQLTGSALGSAENNFKKLVKKAYAQVKPNNKFRTILGYKTVGYTGAGMLELSLDKRMGSSTIRFEFEQYAAPSLSSNNVMASFASFDATDVFQDVPVFKPIRKEMAKIKGLTLFGRTTVYMSAKGKERKQTIVAEVVSVKSGALSSTLFRVPAGYRRVEAKRTLAPLKP
jgi:hypothetical protein